MSARKTFRRAATVAALFASIGAAHAQSNPWTTVGSAGTVDEADPGIVEFVLAEARVRAAAAAGSQVNLRYNVVSLPGFSGPGQYLLRVRFRDNGAGANVRVDLRRHGTNGIPGQVLAFDSNSYPAAVGYQTQQRCVGISWNFSNNAYFFDVAMTKSAASGTPALALIQLIPANCTP